MEVLENEFGYFFLFACCTTDSCSTFKSNLAHICLKNKEVPTELRHADYDNSSWPLGEPSLSIPPVRFLKRSLTDQC